MKEETTKLIWKSRKFSGFIGPVVALCVEFIRILTDLK